MIYSAYQLAADNDAFTSQGEKEAEVQGAIESRCFIFPNYYSQRDL